MTPTQIDALMALTDLRLSRPYVDTACMGIAEYHAYTAAQDAEYKAVMANA